jgi:hypothetical protein
MGKSYRRPFQAICGKGSAKKDKQAAARGVRRKQNEWLRNNWQEEEMGLVPHRYECHMNDVWGWSRDGKQMLSVPTARHWFEYCRIEQGLWHYPGEQSWAERYGFDQWPPRWAAEVTRK